MLSSLWFLSVISLSNSFILQTAQMTIHIAYTFQTKFCISGVLQTKDRLTLDFKVILIEKPPTVDLHLVVEVMDPEDKSIIKICDLPFKLGCSLKIVQGCFCVGVTDNVYFFRYHSAANRLFRNGLLMVDGEVIQGVKFPEIYSANSPVLMKVDGQKSVMMDSDCHVEAATHKNVNITICVEGLLDPTMYLSYADEILTLDVQDCINASFKVLDETEILKFIYTDKCARSVEHTCIVQAFEEIYLKNESDLLTTSPKNTPKRIANVDDSDHLVQFLLIGVLVITLVSSVAIACKMRQNQNQSPRPSDRRPTASTMTVISTAVDPDLISGGNRFSRRLTSKSLSPFFLSRNTITKADHHQKSTAV